MPRIRTVPPDVATGELAAAYEGLKETLPTVPTVFQLSSIRPDLAASLVSLYTALFRDSDLSQATKETIATYVSALNSCPYCVSVHTVLMHQHGATDEQVEAAQAGDISAFTGDEETARFLPLAEKITRNAYKVTDEDTEMLRAAGWRDEQILEAIWVVVFFNLVNRLADSLGITDQDFEADMQRVFEAMA